MKNPCSLKNYSAEQTQRRFNAANQTTETPKDSLILIQILCARGASLEEIWEAAEQGIEQSNSRH